MKKIFYIKNNTENRISYYHLLFFLLSLPFDRFYSTIILVSFLVHTLIFLRKESLKNIVKTVYVLQSVFFVTVAAVTYTVSLSSGLNDIAKQLAILLFPLLLAVTPLNLAEYQSRLLTSFALACTAVVAYLYIDAIHVIWYNRLPIKALFTAAFVNHNFSLPLGMHATYLSMLVVIAIVYLSQQLFIPQPKKIQIVFTISLAILSAGLIQLGSKSVLIALVIITTAGFPFLLVKKEKRYRFIFASLAGFALMLAFVLSVDVFRIRYLVTLKEDLYENTAISERDSRIDRWNTALHLIKNSPLAGTGTGSEIPLLKELYFERKMYSAYLNSMNVHNQYLSFLINSGIAGLLIYLGTLFWGLRQSLITKNVLLFSFIVLVAAVSFSEDLLDVNKGIFFYAFFFPFFIMTSRKPVTPEIE